MLWQELSLCWEQAGLFQSTNTEVLSLRNSVNIWKILKVMMILMIFPPAKTPTVRLYPVADEILKTSLSALSAVATGTLGQSSQDPYRISCQFSMFSLADGVTSWGKWRGRQERSGQGQKLVRIGRIWSERSHEPSNFLLGSLKCSPGFHYVSLCFILFTTDVSLFYWSPVLCCVPDVQMLALLAH